MSAQLELHGDVQNWLECKTYLIPARSDGGESLEADWGADWSWRDDESITPKSDQKPSDSESDTGNGDWLRECIVANSPMADVLVIARKNKAVFFSSEWNMRKSQMNYSKMFQGELSQEENEKITCILCTPLVSKKKTANGGPDWTCVIVGFDSGYVRMYTEHGSLLVNQLFHNQPVLTIKCRSYIPATTTMDHDQLEELFIMYRSVIATMDGFSLFQTLRACRNHTARVQANISEDLDTPPLTFKKWGFEKSPVTDCESVGMHTPCQFDQLCSASLLGGVHARVRGLPYTYNLFVSSSQNPYLAFHEAREGQAQPVMMEFALSVASKLGSSLLNAATGWLGFGGSQKQNSTAKDAKNKEKAQLEPATEMQSRFNLKDSRRIGKSVTISPCRKLCAVTDSLGRVILVDNQSGLAVRIWKGYRDAQCAFVQVDEEVSSRSKIPEKKALFLVIYAPKKGNIEIFAMQQGPKVATFCVSKNGRLLSSSFGMMGLNNIPIRGGNKPLIQCLFVNHDAQLMSLSIPYHLALCDKTSSKVKDLHLLKNLQRILKESEYSHTDIMEILMDVKSQSMINQGFKVLMQRCRQLDVLMSVVQGYVQNFCDDEDKDLTVAFHLQSLLELYSNLSQASNEPPSYSSATEGASGSTEDNTVLHCLHATQREMNTLADMAGRDSQANLKKNAVKSVSFRDTKEIMNHNDFLSAFAVEFDPSKIKANSGDRLLKLNQKSDHLSSLGSLLLCGCLNNQADLADWKKLIKNAGLIPNELMHLTFKFWSNNALASSSYTALMEQLYHVVTALCDLRGYKSVCNEFSQVSKWWEDMRKEIAKSPQIFHIYSFALVCRGVAVDVQNNVENEKRGKEKKSTGETTEEGVDAAMHSSGDEEEWENISFDLIKWNLLMKQIEDLFLLSTILSQRPKLDEPVLPILVSDVDNLSVINLLDKGKGCIAELVGKWLTTIGICPIMVSERLGSTKEDVKDDETGVEAERAITSPYLVIDLLKRLLVNFSVSLSSSIILANYCWEYCLEWNKETNAVEFLTAAIRCVNAIPSPQIRHGMMCMMWYTFIQKKFQPIVSKSKETKDELIEKASGFTMVEKKGIFLKESCSFLDQLMDTTVKCQEIGPIRAPTQKHRKSHWSTDSAAVSLTDLALTQPLCSYEMIFLHYQLMLVAHCSHSFQIKKQNLKPLNLFDTKSCTMFFLPLSNPAPFSSNVEVDLSLKDRREQFLLLVISSAIHAIPEELNTDDDNDQDFGDFKMVKPSLDGVRECELYLQIVFGLGRSWGLDLDVLRINQVCEFYSSGLDLMAIEALGSVNARDIVGKRLLDIVGLRVNYIMHAKCDNVTELVSSFSTDLTNWLKSLQNYYHLRCTRFSKASIGELAQQVLQLSPESSFDYKLAEELYVSSSFL